MGSGAPKLRQRPGPRSPGRGREIQPRVREAETGGTEKATAGPETGSERPGKSGPTAATRLLETAATAEAAVQARFQTAGSTTALAESARKRRQPETEGAR